MTHLRIKKMLALVIVAALSFGVVGCGGNGANVTAPEVTTEVATTEEMDAESLKLKRQMEETCDTSEISEKLNELVDEFKGKIENEKQCKDSKEYVQKCFKAFRDEVKERYDNVINCSVDTYKGLVDDDSYVDKSNCVKVAYEVFDNLIAEFYDMYTQGVSDMCDHCNGLITDPDLSSYYNDKYTDVTDKMEKDYNKAKTRLSDDYTLVSAGFAEGNFDVYDILGKTSESSASEDDNDSTNEAKKKSTKKSKKSKKKKKSSGVDPDLKKALDEYESFMDEYCEFMKKYNSSNDVMSMLNDYTKMMTKYTEMTDKINAIDTDSLSTEDYKYYIEVTSRVSKKLIDAGASM